MRKLTYLWLAGLALSLAACTAFDSEDSRFEQKPGSLASVCGDKWVLKLLRVNGEAVNITQPADFTFLCNRDGQVVGKSGINTYRGIMILTNTGQLLWDTNSFASTKITAPPPLMNQENKYLQALSSSRQALVKNGGARLILRDVLGNIYIEYIKAGY